MEESLEAVTPGWLGRLKDMKWVVVVNQGRGLWQWVEPEEPGWGLEAKGFGSWRSGGGAGLGSWGGTWGVSAVVRWGGELGMGLGY